MTPEFFLKHKTIATLRQITWNILSLHREIPRFPTLGSDPFQRKRIKKKPLIHHQERFKWEEWNGQCPDGERQGEGGKQRTGGISLIQSDPHLINGLSGGETQPLSVSYRWSLSSDLISIAGLLFSLSKPELRVCPEYSASAQISKWKLSFRENVNNK